MLLTTSSGFEGYDTIEYLGLVTKEIVYANGVKKEFSAAISNFFAGLTFQDYEMKGSTELIKNAKNYILEQFIQEAQAKGANAILGIDIETSFGENIYRLSVNGTAVRIQKKGNAAVQMEAKKIPLSCPNEGLFFRPAELLLTPGVDKQFVNLVIAYANRKEISAIEADITFRNIFEDEVCITNMCFLNMQKLQGIHFQSNPCPISLPEHIACCLKDCTLSIRKYIYDGQLYSGDANPPQVETELLQADDASSSINEIMTAFSDIKSSKDMLQYLETCGLCLPDHLHLALSKALKDRFQFERFYGTNHNETMRALQKVIDENT